MKKITEYWLSKYFIERSYVLRIIFGIVGGIILYKIISYSIEWGSNIGPTLFNSAEGQAIAIIGVMITGIIICIFVLYFVRISTYKNLSHPIYGEESKIIIRYANIIQKLKKFIDYKDLSTEEILRYTKILYGILLKLNQVEKTEKNGYQRNRKMQVFLKENSQSILNILIELRNKLRKEIVGEKVKLIKARGDIQRHVTGSESLNHISELQSSRLDHQIEQFEELQKVLVKL